MNEGVVRVNCFTFGVANLLAGCPLAALAPICQLLRASLPNPPPTSPMSPLVRAPDFNRGFVLMVLEIPDGPILGAQTNLFKQAE